MTAAFGVLALLLAAVGIYGVVSYSVEQRTAEMGLRMAVGATPGQILLLMLRGGMAWAAMGIVIGLIGALALSQALASVLFEVQAQDPITFALVGEPDRTGAEGAARGIALRLRPGILGSIHLFRPDQLRRVRCGGAPGGTPAAEQRRRRQQQ